jgi:transcriptional regulator with PAS, ATPase and Fis domain
MAVNCAALPEGLLESEMFGHEKGSFTGATENKEGKFQQAHQSSLLLDEITEMSLPLQAKLLRVLQEHEVDKVGGKAPIPVDVRVIATTNSNIRRRIQDQEFREDLYYRLNVIPLNLIPLRERKDDISLLAEHFMNQFCQENSRSPVKMDPATLALLKKYSWPGNIRELGNIIERTCLMCQGDTLLPSHLFFDDEPLSSGKNEATLTGTISEMEKELILQTLEEFSGNKTKAAESLGISIRTLRNKLNEYNGGG